MKKKTIVTAIAATMLSTSAVNAASIPPKPLPAVKNQGNHTIQTCTNWTSGKKVAIGGCGKSGYKWYIMLPPHTSTKSVAPWAGPFEGVCLVPLPSKDKQVLKRRESGKHGRWVRILTLPEGAGNWKCRFVKKTSAWTSRFKAVKVG